jgi:HK97 family phage major capsid protein
MGSFRMGARLYVRETARIDISENTADDFTKNLVRVRAESRIGLAVLRALAFVKLTGI